MTPAHRPRSRRTNFIGVLIGVLQREPQAHESLLSATGRGPENSRSRARNIPMTSPMLACSTYATSTSSPLPVQCAAVFFAAGLNTWMKDGDVTVKQAIMLRHAEFPGCIVAEFAEALAVYLSDADLQTTAQALITVSLESLRNTAEHFNAPYWAAQGYINVSTDPRVPEPGCLGCKAFRRPGHHFRCPLYELMRDARDNHCKVQIQTEFLSSPAEFLEPTGNELPATSPEKLVENGVC